MSRNRRRREERSSSSHWEPGYRRSYADEYSWRHYSPPTERSSFNYWRDDTVTSTSYYPQRSYGRESYNERLRDDGRSWHAESSSYSRRRRNFGTSRGQGDRDSWRDSDRYPPHRHRDPSRTRHSTHTPPYLPRPSIRARSPVESIPKPAPESPRKASPSSSTSSKLLKPIPEYISLSQQPSETLPDPAMTRKLLVLDLNGTLLIRSARSRVSTGPQLRSVQPRPYMQSFRQYLFRPETKAWLDTMVWSSAQPHSVEDMVDKVFGTNKDELKAVWNRKSLGLSEADYHRKTVSAKDLRKPWEMFASALITEKPQGHSEVQSQSQVIHSAFTTVLLDDSPHKAVLQPYNHVCIPEYDSMRRRHDLQSYLATKEPKQSKKAKRKNEVETAARLTDQIVPELLGALPELEEKEPYDVTLLAVIGILETVKLQSNVAGWTCKGGLWPTEESEEGSAGNGARGIPGSELAHRQTKMWFEDSSVVAFWVARGRRALMELGIQVVHGVTG